MGWGSGRGRRLLEGCLLRDENCFFGGLGSSTTSAAGTEGMVTEGNVLPVAETGGGVVGVGVRVGVSWIGDGARGLGE